MKLVGLIKRLVGVALLTICFSLASVASVQAAECKGMSKTKCETSANCTWVNSYKTKKGKVDAYCRNKPGKSAKKKADEPKVKAKKAKKKKPSSDKKPETKKGKKK